MSQAETLLHHADMCLNMNPRSLRGRSMRQHTECEWHNDPREKTFKPSI